MAATTRTRSTTATTSIGFAPQYIFPDPTTLVLFTCTRYLAAQLDAINADTDLVLFTMGGNDIHFSDIIKQCFALGIRDVDGCRDKVETAKDDVTVVHDQLLAIFTEMRNRGLRDDAKVVLVSYPYLVAGQRVRRHRAQLLRLRRPTATRQQTRCASSATSATSTSSAPWTRRTSVTRARSTS